MAEEPALTGSRGRFLSWLKPSPPRKPSEPSTSTQPHPSSEDHRKLQKLSRPPIGNSAFVPSPSTENSSPHRRLSDSYAVGSLPMEAHRIGIAISAPTEPSHTSLATPGLDDAFQDPKRKSAVFHTGSFHLPGQFQRRSSLIPRHSRSSSLSHDDVPQLSRHTDNVQSSGNHLSMNFEDRRRTIQPLGSPVHPKSHETVMTMMESKPEMHRVTETTWKSSHPAQPVNLPISRANSDAAIYTPVRRRSLIRTPGVATRAELPSVQVTSHSSLYSNHQLSPTQTRHSSTRSSPRRQLSPPIEHPSPSPQRAVTPCEADYKQLGGIKFGSLRITNGAPRPSPVPTLDSETEAEVALPPSSSTRGYFDQSPLSHKTAAAGSREQEAKTPPILFHRPSLRTANSAPPDARTSTGSGVRSAHARGDVLDYPIVEVLDIREDPNAKPSAEKIRQDLECKTLKTLQRSDSGFVSSPSSDGSQKTMSKVDSGYGSSASLRSLRSFKTAVTSRSSSEKLSPVNSGISTPVDTKTGQSILKRPESRPVQQKIDSSWSTAQPSAQSHTPGTQRTLSFTSLARANGFHMPSLRHSKSRELRPSRPRSRSTPSTHMANDVESKDKSSPPPLPSAPAVVSTSPGGKLERLLSSSRRKGPPKVRGGLKSDKQSRLHPALRTETSKETLMTIMSVGSTELLHSGPGRQKNEGQEETKQPMQASQYRGSRRMSLRNAKESITQAATTILASNKQADTPRKPQEPIVQHRQQRPVAPKTTSVQKNTAISGLHHSVSAPGQIVRSPSESLPRRQPSRPVPRQRSSSSSQLREEGHISAHHKLPVPDTDHLRKSKSPPPVSMRTRSGQNLRAQVSQSANHTQGSSMRRPSLPRVNGGLATQSYTQTSTAGQMHHVMSQSGHHSMPSSPTRLPSARELQQAWQINYEQDLRTYQQRIGHHRRESEPPRRSRNSATSQSRQFMSPSQVHQSQSGSYRARSGVIMSHAEQQMLLQQASQEMHASIMGMQSFPTFQYQATGQPTRYQQGHRRTASAHGITYAQNPPFRVLHSYDSPAYRGVPIWG